MRNRHATRAVYPGAVARDVAGRGRQLDEVSWAAAGSPDPGGRIAVRHVKGAAATLADLVARVEHISDWTVPGLGVWDLRALVGHTSRAVNVRSRLRRCSK